MALRDWEHNKFNQRWPNLKIRALLTLYLFNRIELKLLYEWNQLIKWDYEFIRWVW